MKPGQVLTRWWQKLVAGGLLTPQDLYHEARQENPDPAVWERFFQLPDDEGWKAPERLKAPMWFSTNAYLLQGGKADWQFCDHRLMRWAAIFVELARRRGIPLYVHTAFRGMVEQQKAFDAGRSKATPGRSAHGIGEAVDIVHGALQWQLTPQEWQLLHVLGLRALDRLNATLRKEDKLHLTWGGSFKALYDPAHWEISDYRSRLRVLNEGPPVRVMPRAILRQKWYY